MFWTIVGALILVFFILPLILQIVLEIFDAISGDDDGMGCFILTVVFIILLVIIF